MLANKINNHIPSDGRVESASRLQPSCFSLRGPANINIELQKKFKSKTKEHVQTRFSAGLLMRGESSWNIGKHVGHVGNEEAGKSVQRKA